jgi:CHAT domain-containing protein
VPDDYNATERLIGGLFSVPPGTATVTALRRSQDQLMDEAKTSHPYYWAAFAVVGDGRSPLLQPDTSKVAEKR